MLLPVVLVLLLQHSILSLSWLLLPAYASLNVELNVGFHHQLIEAQHGTFLINKRDTWIGLSLSTYGEWEEVTINLLAEFIEEGDTFVDVGANIGAYTIPFAKLVTQTGRVISFEPQRIVSQLLTANVALNEVTNVGVFNAGVGNSNTPLEVPDVLYNIEANFGSISLLATNDWRSKASTSLVPQVQLDNVFVDECPSLIKIDVEGMELAVSMLCY